MESKGHSVILKNVGVNSWGTGGAGGARLWTRSPLPPHRHAGAELLFGNGRAAGVRRRHGADFRIFVCE